ncbi:Signal recognition particle receptor FtsY [Buchnera aphidicola (Cinara splendens)]|uniref:Signal recognition particle receptor FtsY, partial n=1 Tax=Buchnera aphidicola (Cinara splendens) TaxID=2518979 RepID=A0A451DDT4_9GAMM|nr:Signal recognition particle receptor FtsY [Buchnera aphidicola (Cinara splendens)]
MCNKKKNFFSSLKSFFKKKNQNNTSENKKKTCLKDSSSNSSNYKISSFFNSYVHSTKNFFINKINSIFYAPKLDEQMLKELKNLLLSSDFGITATEKILHIFKKHIKRKNLINSKKAIIYFKNLLLNMLVVSKDKRCSISEAKMPFIILIIGVNGVGKTTVATKLAYYYKKLGYSTMVAAGDTYRSAAIDQLMDLGALHGIPVFSKPLGSDPASVVFDAIKESIKQKKNILIIDTAGRLHNKNHLIQELQKINRVINKCHPTAPHEIFLVLDSGIGQNSIEQARVFSSNLPVTGSIITKLDGTAKGGIIFSIAHELTIPICFVGTGDKITDFSSFDSTKFVDSFFNIS